MGSEPLEGYILSPKPSPVGQRHLGLWKVLGHADDFGNPLVSYT
jgi:hypothetical protein